MQIKTIVNYYSRPVRMGYIKKKNLETVRNSRIWKRKPHFTDDGEMSESYFYEKLYGDFSKQLNAEYGAPCMIPYHLF